MSTSVIMDIMQSAMVAGLKIAAPILLISIVIGLVIAIFQAATQIHEQTLTFVPKLFATAIILIILGPWMTEVMSDFVYYIFDIMTTIY